MNDYEIGDVIETIQYGEIILIDQLVTKEGAERFWIAQSKGTYIIVDVTELC